MFSVYIGIIRITRLCAFLRAFLVASNWHHVCMCACIFSVMASIDFMHVRAFAVGFMASKLAVLGSN
jgi:hypothetical protein